jgi:hypothetical protein
LSEGERCLGWLVREEWGGFIGMGKENPAHHEAAHGCDYDPDVDKKF